MRQGSPATLPPSHLLPVLANLQATTAAFETLAGRSAMLGFAIAVFLEAGLLPTLDVQGVFGTFGALEAFAWLGISLVACSTVLALASTRKVLRRSIGKRLLEPVLASLTSKSRSDGAVSGRNVDGALDAVMDSTFSAAFLRAVLPSEADEPYI